MIVMFISDEEIFVLDNIFDK